MLVTLFYHLLLNCLPAPPQFSFLPAPDSSFAHIDRTDTLLPPAERFKKATALSQYLFNGPRYHVYDRTAKTHQFYKSRSLLSGTLHYDGRDYGPLNMHFDISLKQLVVEQPFNGYLVRLDTAKIAHFTIDGDYFRSIADHPQLKKGFYQIISDEKTKLYCRRSKQRIEKAEDQTLYTIFLTADAFYMSAPGRDFVRIQKKKDLFRYFPQHKALLRSYFRANRSTSFKEDIEQHLREVVKIIDHPSHHL